MWNLLQYMRQHLHRIHNKWWLNMATCKWCGKEFKKTHNRQQYGTTGIHRFYIINNQGESIETTCQQEATKEKTRNRRNKHYHKTKDNTNYTTPTSTILGNSNLTANPSNSHKVESYLIQKELHRLGLRNITHNNKK